MTVMLYGSKAWTIKKEAKKVETKEVLLKTADGKIDC